MVFVPPRPRWRRGILVKRNDIAFLPVSRGQVLLRLILGAIELELLAADIAQVQLPVSCQWVAGAQLLHLQNRFSSA